FDFIELKTPSQPHEEARSIAREDRRSRIEGRRLCNRALLNLQSSTLNPQPSSCLFVWLRGKSLEVELESELEDALRESAGRNLSFVCRGQNGRRGRSRQRAVGIDRNHGVDAGNVQDVEEVGEFANDLNAHRFVDWNETRITQIHLPHVA